MSKENAAIKIMLTPGIGEYTEKKSRFIATAGMVGNEEEAAAFVNEMKKKYWDARHNCMAYVLGEKREIIRFSDDGEPSGTAGKPILDVILGSNIINAAIVVTRYFGGVLLGTGGLVRAYQKAAVNAVDNSVTAEKRSGIKCRIATDYNGFGKLQFIAAQEEVELEDIQYTDIVTMDMICEAELFEPFKNKVTEATAAKAVFAEAEEVGFYRSQKGIILI